jgi:hypothetical protein
MAGINLAPAVFIVVRTVNAYRIVAVAEAEMLAENPAL